MDVDFSKISTSHVVCETCCEVEGRTLRWGIPDWVEEGYEDEYSENSFDCPVTNRTIYNADEIGSLQPDCPRRREHACAAGVNLEPATEVQGRLLELTHNSYHLMRLKYSSAERAFLEGWQRINKRSPCLNGGYTALEHILMPEGYMRPEQITQRDAFIAASVIQWLGTSCGAAFLWDCERLVKKATGAERYEERRAQKAFNVAHVLMHDSSGD